MNVQKSANTIHASASNVTATVTSPNPSGSSNVKSVSDVATTLSGGPGPWMLMSYKNKKSNPAKTTQNFARPKSGSRFSLLQTSLMMVTIL